METKSERQQRKSQDAVNKDMQKASVSKEYSSDSRRAIVPPSGGTQEKNIKCQ